MPCPGDYPSPSTSTTGFFQKHPPQSCKEWTQWLLQHTTSLGLVVNLPKSDLTPKQVFDYIGITFNHSNGLACSAHCRVQTFLYLLKPSSQSPSSLGCSLAADTGTHDIAREVDSLLPSAHTLSTVCSP